MMASEVTSVIASARSTVTHFLRHPFSADNPGNMAPDHVPLLAPRLDEEAARTRLRRNRILATGMLAGVHFDAACPITGLRDLADPILQ
jgi:hypothetical protein